MMKEPLISVLLCTYNDEKYIYEAVNSILNQTFNNFEFIIINDGSTDNSLEIIKQFTDPRIIIVNQENRGLLKSLIYATTLCRGEFIARMDHDDISIVDRLQRQVAFLRKNLNISVVSGAVEYIDEDGNKLGRSFPPTSVYAINKYLLNFGCVIVHPAVMMRRLDFIKIGGYSSGAGERFQDYHLWVKFVRNGLKIKNESRLVLSYRVIQESITSQFTLNENGFVLLREFLNHDEPDFLLLEALNAACKHENKGIISRIDRLQNLENKFYNSTPFINQGIKSKFISQLKNISVI